MAVAPTHPPTMCTDVSMVFLLPYRQRRNSPIKSQPWPQQVPPKEATSLPSPNQPAGKKKSESSPLCPSCGVSFVWVMPLTQWPVLLSRPFVDGYRLQKSCLFTHDAPTAHRGEVTSVVRYPFLSLTCRRHCVVISHRLTFFFRFPSSHQLLGKFGDLLDRRRRPHQTASNKPTVRCFPPHVIDRPSLEVTLDETF